jgi:hypothetical protein
VRHGDTSRAINWFIWTVVTSRPSRIFLLLASIGRIHLLLRNIHERRETRLVLGRINNISHGRIGCLIRMKWINIFPLRRVNSFSLWRVKL